MIYSKLYIFSILSVYFCSTNTSGDMVDMREIDNSLDIDDGSSSEYSSAPSTQEIVPENFEDFESDDIYDFPMTF